MTDTNDDHAGGAGGPAFHRPTTIAEASRLLAADGSVALAGGQDLVRQIHSGALRPAAIVSLDRIEALRRVVVIDPRQSAIIPDPGPDFDPHDTGLLAPRLRIGAMATLAGLAADPNVRALLPGFVELLSGIGDIRVRGSATLGGNLVRANPWHDPPVALAAYRAQVVLEGPRGSRRINVEELATGTCTTVLQPDELLRDIEVPLPPAGAMFGYCSLPNGHRDMWPVAQAAAVVAPDRGRAHVAIGAAGPVTQVLDVEPLHAAGDQVANVVNVIGDALASGEYRRHLAAVAVERAIHEALRRGAPR